MRRTRFSIHNSEFRIVLLLASVLCLLSARYARVAGWRTTV